MEKLEINKNILFFLNEVHTHLTDEQISTIIERLNNDDYLDEEIATAIDYALDQEGWRNN
jgi:ribosome assembly protein YihI (activator of Der GTPase)